MGRRDSIPAWILKYKDRIERGEITLEEILEEENKIRKKPIKLATVKRAVNALGFSVEGMRAIPPEKRAEFRERAAAGRAVEGVAEVMEQVEEEVEEPMEESWQTAEEETAAAEYAFEAAEEEEEELTAAVEAEEEAFEREREEEEVVKKRREGAPAWILKYKEKIERGEITAEEILEEENKRREKPIKLSTVKRAINALGFSIGALKREEEEAPARRRERPGEEEEGAVTAGAAAFQLSISGETKRLFQDVKRRWEESLGKSLPDEYFLNILLVLAKLAERGKTLLPRKS